MRAVVVDRESRSPILSLPRFSRPLSRRRRRRRRWNNSNNNNNNKKEVGSNSRIRSAVPTTSKDNAGRRQQQQLKLNSSTSTFCSSSSSESSLVSTTSSTETTTTTTRKVVRFPNDEVTSIHAYDAVSTEYKHLVYTASEEIRQSKMDASALATLYAESHKELITTIEKILDSPFQRQNRQRASLSSSSSSFSQLLQTEEDDNNDGRVQEEEEEEEEETTTNTNSLSEYEAIRMLCSWGEGRGLLDRMMSNIIRKTQRHVIASVLSRQRSLLLKKNASARHCCGSSASSATAIISATSTAADAMILRSRYEFMNCSARELAIKLAQGDAIEARKIYNEEEDEVDRRQNEEEEVGIMNDNYNNESSTSLVL